MPVTVTQDDVVVTVGDDDVTVTLGATQGPAGPSGGGGTLATSSGIISGHKAVAWRSDGKIEAADRATAAHAIASVGVITQAVVADDVVSVTTFGAVTEGSWSWTPLGLIFVGAAGALTQTVPTFPTSLFARVIGHAITATSMWVDVQPPTNLA